MNTDPPPLPPRSPEGHKGTFGAVAVFGGRAALPSRMIGAPALAAAAALRAGAGLARLATPEPITSAALTLVPSATGLPIPTDPTAEIIPAEAARILAHAAHDAHALVVGPGLGVTPATASLVLQAALQEDAPVVLDADALTALAHHPQFHRDFRARAVLTPHPGEHARLAAALGLEGDPTCETQRPDAAQRLAAFLGAVVVLKGPRTIVATAIDLWRHDAALPQLATAGAGDVLAGLIAGLIASNPELSLFDAARHAVAVHADAARDWAADARATGGMLATDLLERIPAAVEARRTPPTPAT